jgi:hypothetical protein
VKSHFLRENGLFNGVLDGSLFLAGRPRLGNRNFSEKCEFHNFAFFVVRRMLRLMGRAAP